MSYTGNEIDLLHTRRWRLNNKKYGRSLAIKPFVDIENRLLKIVHVYYLSALLKKKIIISFS